MYQLQTTEETAGKYMVAPSRGRVGGNERARVVVTPSDDQVRGPWPEPVTTEWNRILLGHRLHI